MCQSKFSQEIEPVGDSVKSNCKALAYAVVGTEQVSPNSKRQAIRKGRPESSGMAEDAVPV